VRAEVGRSPERAVTLAAAITLTAAAVLFVLMAAGTGDYAPVSSRIPSTTDDAAPAIAALLHGNLTAFAHDQPALGLTSLLLRLPFAGLARAFGSGLLGEYRAGALPCLAGCVVLGTLLARALARRGAAPVVAVGALVVVNPLTLAALQAGHPEELLAAALVVGAVLAAEARRPLAAALLLGLALGTKQWAFLAIPPVLLALAPGVRLRGLLVAGGLAAILVLPAPLLSPSAYRSTSRSMANGSFVSPQSAWWPVATRRDIALPTGRAGHRPRARYVVLPAGLDRGDVWLLLLAGAVMVLAAGLRRPFRAEDGLRLLAALMLARVLVDPFVMPYYGLPLAFALLAMARRDTRAAVGAAGVLVGLHLAGLTQPPGTAFALTAAWAVPTALMLGGARLPRLTPRVHAV
jgi:hypothetical protein